MPIRRKSSIDKQYYERIGQGMLFGHDNIHFKTINLSKKQRFKDLCKIFRLKKLVKDKSILLDLTILK
tara:strand:+ start:1320 stop:1523 length:204 start_codon:yes stop_codon:yes gene_type:complete